MSDLWGKIIIYFLFVKSYCYANPSVTIKQGPLEGINIVTHDSRIVSGFLGIPYARPPIGKLRFKAPQPPKSWSGTYRAENDSIKCTQVLKGKITGGEDCLYLNVYTPQLPKEKPSLLPVMVFIHGGSFIEGSGSSDSYGASYILDHDIVLVVFNYRLGVFGFLSTGDKAAPGNYGLKDQRMVLRWVQRNIGAFGGDPNRVTLFGLSAGAACAHILSLSKKTEGLFDKLILQSGTAISLWAYRDKSLAAKKSREIAEYFNCLTDNSTVIVRCLRSLKASSIASWNPPSLETLFLPTNELESDEAIITDHPVDIVERGEMRDLPWICGNVRDEGLLVTAYDYFNSTKLEDTVLHLNSTIKKIIQIFHRDNIKAEDVMAYYFNDWTVNRTTILRNLTDFLSDFFFLYPTLNLVQAQTRIGSQAAYRYFFEYRGTFSMSYEMTGNDTDIGVCHTDDGIYLFPRANTTFAALKKNMTETDLNMMKRLTGLWTSFAINGIPTLPRMDNAEEWRKYDDRGSYLHIGSHLNTSLIVMTSFYENRMNFCKKLLGQLHSGSEDASANVITIFIATYVILFYIYSY